MSFANSSAGLRTKKMEEEQQQHIKEKEIAKTLQSPHNDSFSFYYSKKLKTFHFTITNI